jgi:hypothetical protein
MAMVLRALLVSLVMTSAARAQPCSELPVLYIVQDKSGSMAGTPTGGTASAATPSKWSIASQVVPQMAAQFANRFRYGVMMYPGASTNFSCTTGVAVQAVPSTSSQVASAYAAYGPGGGTPTAAALQQARAALTAFATTAPRYVLLITDGLPNCNLALNPATCATTTPGCPNTSTCVGTSCCGLGAKDCLDTTSTAAAAGALFAQGVKVYVVGFDQSLTSGNNKAVLDAIASAGGTGSAYVASNQAALTSALNQIAQQTSTCCQNACTAGANRCTTNGGREECRLDPTTMCTNWVGSTCPPMSVCTAGSCQACTNQCTLGASQCSGNTVRTCVTGPGGCTQWQTSETCSYGEVCANGSCNSCTGCAVGASRCTATGVEECEWNVLSGCTQWAARTCPTGSVCANGTCASCTTACTAGAKRCTGRSVETCVADPRGCTSWSVTEACTTFCSGGACGVCGTSCANGTMRCNGNGIETCGIDANNCPVWGPAQSCPPNASCANGTCTACATTCTEGTKRCGASGVVETCQLTATGCRAWAQTGQCDLGGGERCDLGVCIPPCMNQCPSGAKRCTANAPQRCDTAPTGCTVWRDEAACRSGTTCIGGACFEPCGADEFESCAPAGTICTGLPEGKFCLPMGGVGGGSAGVGGGAAGGEAGGSAGGGDAGGAAAGGASGMTGGGTAGSGSSADGGTRTVGAGSTELVPDMGRIGAKGMGCGCSEASAVAPLLGLVLLLRRRRVTA